MGTVPISGQQPLLVLPGQPTRSSRLSVAGIASLSRLHSTLAPEPGPSIEEARLDLTISQMLVSLLGLLFSLFSFISRPYMILFLFVGVSVCINILGGKTDQEVRHPKVPRNPT